MEESTDPVSRERILQARDEYQLGLAFFARKQWKTAARHFRLAAERLPRRDSQIHLYRSCHGLSLVYCGDVSGLNLCRNAAASDTARAEVLLNLALAELKFKHRRRACEALSLGLRSAPRHSGLLKLRSRIGVRRQPCLPFLKRENPLNKWLGRVTYHPRKRR